MHKNTSMTHKQYSHVPTTKKYDIGVLQKEILDFKFELSFWKPYSIGGPQLFGYRHREQLSASVNVQFLSMI